ncbi:MAG: hypothetical protein WA918_01490 [Erythrobacter sp.]
MLLAAILPTIPAHAQLNWDDIHLKGGLERSDAEHALRLLKKAQEDARSGKFRFQLLAGGIYVLGAVNRSPIETLIDLPIEKVMRFDVPHDWHPTEERRAQSPRYVIGILPQGRGMGKPVHEVYITTNVSGDVFKIEITETLTAPF